MEQTTQAPRVVRVIPPTVNVGESIKTAHRQLRVVAYCRVSTTQDEQLNSYENQVNYYTERIYKEPDWTLVRIYADKGITGTSVKKRDEFNKMIRLCKQGKVDMIICKSISRFARNTVDCLKYTRMLKDLGVTCTSRNKASIAHSPARNFTSPSTAQSHRANPRTLASMSDGARRRVPRKVRYHSTIRIFSATDEARTVNPKSSPKKRG